MRKYDPKARVDQLAEYRTSEHGKRNAQGDTAVATCIDCHGAHGIRPVSSPDSTAYAVNVPLTCARCHSDATLMARYGLKANQYDEYRRSIHAAALIDRGDTAAPACNDCHGNHGATPPGVQSIAQVCGQCHGRESALFRASIKKNIFDEMGLGECTVCHGNHQIGHPTPELFHASSAPEVTSGEVTGADPFVAALGDLDAGRTVTARWRSVLRPHVLPDDERLVQQIEIAGERRPVMVLDGTVRPGDAETLAVARVAQSGGLSATLTIEPLSGIPVEAGDALAFRLDVTAKEGGTARGITVRTRPAEAVEPVRGSVCLTCHQQGDTCDHATERMYSTLGGLERELRSAAALLHRAEVAGMPVSTPLFELRSKGTTASVESRTLVHAFEPDRVEESARKGKEIARAALAAARGAMEEIEFRRRGLAVSLVLIAIVLLALFVKIRQLPPP
jgi:hypothetical protein